MSKTERLPWKCHTPKLLEEVLNNQGTSALRIPLNILLNLLRQVAQRAIQLDDVQLNALMIKLTLYSCADPTLEDYDSKLCEKVLKEAKTAKQKEKEE